MRKREASKTKEKTMDWTRINRRTRKTAPRSDCWKPASDGQSRGTLGLKMGKRRNTENEREEKTARKATETAMRAVLVEEMRGLEKEKENTTKKHQENIKTSMKNRH